ncbi:MAG TPA: helix-turn-helix domain-containing protein [Micromonospora sp.]
MVETRFTTDDLPEVDRWPSWRDFNLRSHLPNHLQTEHRDRFRGTAGILDLGSIQVSTLTYSPLEVARTPKLIRQSDPGVWQFALHRRGRLRVAQGGREAQLTGRDFILYDTSRPYSSWADADRGAVAGCMVVLIPKHLMPLRARNLEPLNGVALSGRHGFGALLTNHLVELTRNAASYTAADALRLGPITLDLIAASYAHELDAADRLSPETRQRALVARIHHHIRQRLGDPDLTPETIAVAHGISVRHLHRLFQDQDLTVTGWIRRCRLERCRQDLADPALRHRPVHAIATRWGFTSHAHFTRLFRATYGMPPSECRPSEDLNRQAAGTHGRSPSHE